MFIYKRRAAVTAAAAMLTGFLALYPGGNMEVYADLEPFYNLSVSVSSELDRPLNEKIEVYVEKDGKYYGDFDLNQVNDYCYQTEAETGIYRLYARVRYDRRGDYQISPSWQDITIEVQTYKSMHSAVFYHQGKNGEMQAEEDSHTLNEYVPSAHEKVYTIDEIDELRNIQEQSQKEGEEALKELDEWEQENNFLTQHGISDPAVRGKEQSSLPKHSYPSDLDEIQEKEIHEQAQETKESEEHQKITQESVITEEEPEEEKTNLMLVMVSLIIILAGIVWFIRKKGQ